VSEKNNGIAIYSGGHHIWCPYETTRNFVQYYPFFHLSGKCSFQKEAFGLNSYIILEYIFYATAIKDLKILQGENID